MKKRRKNSLFVLLVLLYFAIAITLMVLGGNDGDMNIYKAIAILMTVGVAVFALALVLLVFLIHHIFQLITGKPLIDL